MKRFAYGVLAASVLFAGCSAHSNADATQAVQAARLPAGFQISVFSDQVPEARSLALGDDGVVYVGSRDAGKVYALRDADGDGRAESAQTVLSDLELPNGVAYKDGALYVAEMRRIVRYTRSGTAWTPSKVLYSGLPPDRNHGSRYLRFGPDGKLYVAIGVPCNICQAPDERQGTLARLDPDSGAFEIIARGIRNSVGFDWQPGSQALYFTDNGRDGLGDERPPEELNRLDRVGQHFGYPYCHADDIADPEFGAQHACSEFSAPVWRFPAHRAALGVHFYSGTQFPTAYQGSLLVAQHGSWNRSTPAGYAVVAVRFEHGQPVGDSVLIDGWLKADGTALARPVDVLPLPDGSVLVSDDRNGAVYRVRYQAQGG